MTGGQYSTGGQVLWPQEGGFMKTKITELFGIQYPDRALRHELDQHPENGGRRVRTPAGSASWPRGPFIPTRRARPSARSASSRTSPSGPMRRFSFPGRPETPRSSWKKRFPSSTSPSARATGLSRRPMNTAARSSPPSSITATPSGPRSTAPMPSSSRGTRPPPTAAT